jgi:general secretion pathway protein I
VSGRTTAARRPTRGFTLLEVMIALAILSGALVTISEVVGGALRNHVRARQLEVATLLARGKMVDLESEFERKGFRDFDQKEEGSFDAEGHPEVRWTADVVKPEVELSADRILQLFMGGKEGGMDELLKQLMPAAAEGGPQASTGAATAAVTQGLNAQLKAFGEQVKKGVREVRLTVSWPEGKATRSFTVVTHMVVLSPTEPGA